MGIVSAVTGLIGAGKQKKLAKRQARAAEAQAAAQREQQRIEQVRANVSVREQRQNQLREARVRRAQILSTGLLSGAEGATTLQNSLGTLNTQFGANIGRINVAQGFGQAIGEQSQESANQASEINRLEGKKAVVQANTQFINAIGGLGESIFKRFAPGPGSFGGGAS